MKHVISGLNKKYQKIAAEINDLRRQIDAKEKDLAGIKTALKIFDPNNDFTVTRQRVFKNRSVGRGKYIRTAIDVLREAKEPMTLREITVIVAERLFGDDKDRKLETVQWAIDSSLKTHIKRGAVTVDRTVYPKRYALAKD